MQKGFYFNLFSKQNIKNFLNRLSIISDDIAYNDYFEDTVGLKIYKNHLATDYISCIFCCHLNRSGCHQLCFSCSNHTHMECSCLLPGTFSYSDSYFHVTESEATPWIFKTPCTHFERLDCSSYFKNFISSNHSITAENYEALEGLFTGLVHNKRPCHICASVNLSIYNKCTESGKTMCSESCGSVYQNLAQEYYIIASQT